MNYISLFSDSLCFEHYLVDIHHIWKMVRSDSTDDLFVRVRLILGARRCLLTTLVFISF